MPGEIGGPSTFDVTNLECFERETSTQQVYQSSIIDWGEEFFFRATFEGTGPLWENLTRNRFQYIVKYYAEGMGSDANGDKIDDLDMTETVGSLIPGQSVYEIDSPIYTVNDEGVYRCAVTVTFRMPGGQGLWFGVLGFFEGCVIQINPMEEWE